MIQTDTCDWLLVDAGNVLYSTFYANKDVDELTVAGLALHQVLTRLRKYYNKVKPTKGVVMAFDSPNWRKIYTESGACTTGHVYKGHRRKNMTPSEQARYEKFLEHVRACQQFLTENTTIYTLKGELLEADDLIAGFVQLKAPEDVAVILSADSDLYQLLRYPNTFMLNPSTDKYIDLSDYHGSPEFYLFQKCIRGDLASDNIPSAYPRVRSDRLWKAFNDPFEMTQLLKSTWNGVDGKPVLVEDRFLENKLLIDLSQQPDMIRQRIAEVIAAERERAVAFNFFRTMKFIGKYELNVIRDSIDQYVPMLSLKRD